MKHFHTFPIIAISALVAVVVAFFAISYILEFRPEEEMPLCEYFGRDDKECGQIPDTIKIMSWNIGYAGLGDNMDFCVDGGKKVRDTKERTQANLEDIISRLKEENADIYTLQEVDVDAHRTYGINEVKAICEALPDYYAYFAPSFKVWFVPSPLKEPIGKVESGQLTLSRFAPKAALRIQYPSAFPFPVCMFNLKRCLLETDFITSSGKTLHLGNTHGTAFDTGGMRSLETALLKEKCREFAHKSGNFIFVGDWNQYPPQYKASKEELENQYFVPQLLDTSGFSPLTRVVCDTSTKSMRFNDKPYSQESTTSILDFFAVSSDVQVIDMHTLDLRFHSSDHNPVVMTAVVCGR